MAISKNRVRVNAVGGDVGVPFSLGTAVASFANFPNGLVKYAAVEEGGDWQIGTGTVTGTTLTRGTVEENHLGTTAQVNFTGKTMQIAQIMSVAFINEITDKLDGIEDGATADQVAGEVNLTPTGSVPSTNVQDAVSNLDTRITALSVVDDGVAIAIAQAVKHIGIDPPIDPIDGQEWLKSDTMAEYTWYVGVSGNQWVRNI